MKYLLFALALPLLFACTAEPIDFKYTNIANDVFYAKKTGKPFSGTINNVPHKSFAKDDFNLMIDTYNSFLTNPENINLEQSRPKYNDIMCTIEVKDGVLNGKTQCQYSLALDLNNPIPFTIEANYKNGHIADNNTYQSVNDQKIKIMTAAFTGSEYNHFDMTMFSAKQPDVVRMTIAKRPDKTILDFYSPKSILLTHTEITETSSVRDFYDPKTGQKLGSVTFAGSTIWPLSENSNGYVFFYSTNADTLETKISEARFIKDPFNVFRKSYEDNESFNMTEFNQYIKETTQLRESLNDTKEREINSQTFSDIIFENQQREHASPDNETSTGFPEYNNGIE